MPHRRSIRHYAPKRSRLSKAQRAAIERHWSEFGVDYRNELLDLHALFRRAAPKILDIGTGMGETTILLAREHPENDYLAVEMYRPGIGRLLYELARHELANVRVINHDAVEVVSHQLPVQSLSSVYIHFPDPWPKRRHHKRRLVTPDFISTLATRMKTEAQLYLATDFQDLAEYMMAVCDAEPGLINLAGSGNFSPRPRWRPSTKFEQRGLNMDNRIHNLIYCRRYAAQGD